MKVSRREFVVTAGCAAAASLCALPTFGFADARKLGARNGAGCALLDLESNCALPESIAGMRAALGDAHRRVTATALGSDVSVVVVPAAGAVRDETFVAVRELVEGGATVLWESGAAFLEPHDFARQQALTLEHFGISMELPIDVWSRLGSRTAGVGVKNQSARNMRAIGHAQIPYVAYCWPREAHVRDFSRVIPVSATAGEAVAHWGEIPVAWSRSLGGGTIVFLGSPIGPALHAGDADAGSLLQSLIKG
jgi:hypothetical protein